MEFSFFLVLCFAILSVAGYNDELRARQPGFHSRQRSLVHSVHDGSRTHPASYPMSTAGSFPELKRPWRETDHSPSSTLRSSVVDLYLHSPTSSW
jgi:hypothetical protein